MGNEPTRGSSMPVVADPRPRVVEIEGVALVAGSRCQACGYPNASGLQRCPECAAECKPVEFGPRATVFAATVLRVPVPGRTPPYALAYIDLDDGPRILAHVEGTDHALVPGDRVRVVGVTEQGDPLVALDSTISERTA